MEGGRVRSCLIVLVVLLGVFAEQSNGFSLVCLAKCFPWTCPLTGPAALFKCAGKCALECAFQHGPVADAAASINGAVDIVDDVQYYCNVGCTTHLCAPLNTPTASGLETLQQVKLCADRCRTKCSKRN